MSAPRKPALTEGQLLDRLRVRYTEKSDARAFVRGVRSAAGLDAQRTIDGYAMALWPSRGLTLPRSSWRALALCGGSLR
jgi:hypothetical protein